MMHDYRPSVSSLLLTNLALLLIQPQDVLPLVYPLGPVVKIIRRPRRDHSLQLLEPGRAYGHELSPPGKTKNAQATTPRYGASSAQALVSLDAGSGASIFTMDSCLQCLHLTGRSRMDVPGKSFISLRPQTGHIAHPSFTTSLPHIPVFCNTFPSFFDSWLNY